MERLAKKYYAILFFLSLTRVTIIAQVEPREYYNQMNSAMIMGLEDKGLTIANELISLDKYKDYREQALYYLGEYFFTQLVLSSNPDPIIEHSHNINNSSKAYTMYLWVLKDYPQSKYKDVIDSRISYLENQWGKELLFADLNSYLRTERYLLSQKLKFITSYSDINFPNELEIYLKSDNNEDAFEKMLKYFDDIIINNPTMDLYGYSYKLYTLLSMLEVRPTSKSISRKPKMVFPKFGSYDEFSKTPNEIIIEIWKILKVLEEKYSSDQLTLYNHLIVANEFIELDIMDLDNPRVVYLLEYVLKNDPDKWGLRYLFTKEFVINSKFNTANNFNSIDEIILKPIK